MSSPSGHGILHRTNSSSNMHSPTHAQQQSLPTPPHNYPVRLMKLSSAHALLNSASKPGQKMLHRLALIIQESATMANESTKGKLPVEAAYVVMKKVTERAGTPIMPVGMSTFNKLESLRTDPAVTVLKSQTWKDFFTSQRPNSPNPGLRAGTNQLKPPSQSKTDNPETDSKDGPTLLDVIVDTLIGRVEMLWDELKVLEKERQFYRKSLCKFPATSFEQCKDLSIYVDALQEHKVATKAVLFAIQARERAVKRCYDVLLALNRKYARILSIQREGTGSSSVSLPRPSSAPPTPSLSKTHKTEGSPSGIGTQAFWKEELIVALDEVRCCSLDVIKSIQQWRRSLWRPHAFMYHGQNYLFKMRSDMSVLESDIYQRLLAFLPLTSKQLVGVLFTPSLVDSLSREGLLLDLPPRMVHTQTEEGTVESVDEALRVLLYEFTHNIEAGELEAAARVVLQEEALQKAVHTEHQSLLHKGVFIPLLRIKFLSETDEETADT